MLLVLLLSVYVNLVKELFLLVLLFLVSSVVDYPCFLESECKGTPFLRTGKMFSRFFLKKGRFWAFV